MQCRMRAVIPEVKQAGQRIGGRMDMGDPGDKNQSAVSAASAAAEETGTALPAGTGQHVLYLDDQPAKVFLVARVLRQL